MKELCGYQGKILIIDLSSKKYEKKILDKNLAQTYIGSIGINAKLLFDHIDPHADPLSPDNALIFGVGPLVGSGLPASSRMAVTTKSPITGIYTDSNAGGSFGINMKKTGYDHIVIKGKSADKVYLYITENEIQILSADDFWGLDTFAADSRLKSIHGKDCETARIGRAGENLVLFANIVTSTRRIGVFGRTGVGAVMGSKNLKAIVVKGSKVTSIKEPLNVSGIKSYLLDKIKNSIACQDRKKNGTLNVMTGLIACDELWKHNHREKAEEAEGFNLDPSTFLADYYTGKNGCDHCPLACSLKWSVKEGKFKGESGGKIEFGHTFPLGVNIGIFQFPDVLHLANLTNKYGIDSVETGYVLSMITECFEKGIIADELLSSIELKWGNAAAYEKLLECIAERKGIGDILAFGTKKAAKKLGEKAEQYALNVKGLGYGLESSQGWSLGILTSTRGGDHSKAFPISLFGFGIPFMMDYVLREKSDNPDTYDMNAPDNKGRYIWWHENYKALIDSLGLCLFPYLMLVMGGDCLEEDLNVMYKAVTGIEMEDADFKLTAERICQMQKIFNYMLGLDRKDDEFQKRPLDKKWQDLSPYTQIESSHEGMLDEYYQYRGCSSDGIPLEKTLKKVGLENFIDSLKIKKNITKN